MTACPDENLIAAFAEGLLSAESEAGVHEHVDRCEPCRHALAALAVAIGGGSRDAGPARTPSVVASVGGTSAPAPTPAALEVRFELISTLGSGGMGTVYEAVDRATGGYVAVKTLRSLNPVSLYRFKREFRALAGLQHPNLVTLHELICEQGLWYTTMEVVRGVDFLTYVRGVPAAERFDRLRAALLQLCDGLIALHGAGHVHRDIKPSNVLATAHGRIVLLDFGLVADIDAGSRLTDRGLAGTVIYMAPEQAVEQVATPASDWYAVGIMLYQALTGTLPFRGQAASILADKQASEPPAPSTLDADVPADLDRLCVQLLRRDPTARPSATELRARLAEATPGNLQGSQVPLARGGTVPFVGRSTELRQLRALYDQARTHRDVLVATIAGPSGIGKTTLVEQLLAGLRETTEPPWTLAGTCHERESVPFKAFDALVDGLTRHLRKLSRDELMFVLPSEIARLAHLFPVVHRVAQTRNPHFRVEELSDANERKRHAYAALCDLLGNMARLRPLVLWIDDLHWADSDSIELLDAVLRANQIGGALVVVTVREDQAATLQHVSGLHARPVTALRLGPVAEKEALELAESTLAGRGPRAAAGEVVGEAGGNPFFIRELCLLLITHQGRGRAGDATLDTVVQERLAALPPDARTLLSLLCVGGGSLPKGLLRAALGSSDGSSGWHYGIAALRAESLVREHGPREVDRVETTHDVICRAVLERLGAEASRQFHRQLAEAVEEHAPGALHLLARHWAAAGEPSRAGVRIERAAAVAHGEQAFDRAAQLYRMAHEVADAPARRASLGAALGDALADAGRPGESATAYSDAARSADPAQRAHLRQRATRQWLTGGYMVEGLAAAREALQEVGVPLPATPSAARRSLGWQRLALQLRGLRFRERKAESVGPRQVLRLDTLLSLGDGLSHTDPILAAGFHARFLRAALDSGVLQWVGPALSREAMRSAFLGAGTDRTLAMVARAEAVARRAHDDPTVGACLTMRAAVALCAGDTLTALETATRAEQRIRQRCVGARFELALARWLLCLALRRAGELERLAVCYETYLEEARRLGDHLAVMSLQTTCSIVWLARDDAQGGARQLGGLLESWPGEAFGLPHVAVRWAQIDHAIYEGRVEAAWKMASGERSPFENSLLRKSSLMREGSLLRRGRAALALAESTAQGSARPELLTQVADVVRSLGRETNASATAWASLMQAAASWLQSRDDRGAPVRQLNRAIAELETAGCQAMAAAARRRKGELLAGDEGDELVAAADRWLAGQGVKNPARFASLLAPGFGAG